MITRDDELRYLETDNEEEKIEHNKKLVEEFIFLMPKNRWSGDKISDYDYSYTELDAMPKGWRKAFGIDLCYELKDLLIKAEEISPYKSNSKNYNFNTSEENDDSECLSWLEAYSILEIKEKYGWLRWYDNGYPSFLGFEYHDILRKYESRSVRTCIECGAPTEYISTGWIVPFCRNCALDALKTTNQREEDLGLSDDQLLEKYFAKA